MVILVAITLVAVILLSSVVSTYNSLVTKNEAADAQWAQVENQYQRKIDLIPEIYRVAVNYTQFERSVLENITRLRSQWLNASSIQQRVNVTNELNQNLYAIQVTVERYPELQSVQVIQNLMVELAGTENRIAVERGRFNEAVRAYNVAASTFPGVLWAGMFGFQPREYYNPIPGGP